MKKVQLHKKSIARHITAVIFFLFFTTVLIGGFVLKRGIQFESFSVGATSVKEFALQWDDRLKLNIKSVSIDNTTPSNNTLAITDIIQKALPTSHLLLKVFSEITIDAIYTAGQTVSFQFKTTQEKHLITLDSKEFTFHSSISISESSVLIDNAQFSSDKFDSKGSGKIGYNRSTEKFSGSMDATIASSIPITLDFSGDNRGLTFNGMETGEILTITPLVDLFGLQQNIQRWITDYLTGSRYILKSFSGVIPWDNPQAILNTLKAQIEVVDCKYTFAQGFEPIRSESTTVEFKNGILNIFPEEATFYDQSTGTSWLDINFNDYSNILLTAYISTESMANKDILTLLDHYKIPLPFTQTSGKTETDLALKINLSSQEITAEGKFVIPNGTFEYKDTQYHITNAEILLNNSTISIADLTLASGEIFEGKVRGSIQFSQKTGSLDITLTHFKHNIGEYALVLNDKLAAPTFQYHITPEKHWIDASPSFWLYNNKPFSMGRFSAPFIEHDFTITLPTTTLSAPPSLITDISGTFSLVRKFFDARCNLKYYRTDGITLQTANLPFAINFDGHLELQTEAKSTWELNGTPTQLSPVDISLKNNVITWPKTSIQFGENLSSTLSGNYNLERGIGELLLSELHIQSKSAGELLNSKEDIVVNIKKSNATYLVSFPQLDTSISIDADKNWQATINDITPLATYSKELQHYLPHGGYLTVWSIKNNLPYYFTANIPTKPPLIKLADNDIEELDISGTIQQGKTEIDINEAIKVDYDGTLNVHAKSVDFELATLISLFKQESKVDDKQEPQESTSRLPVNVETIDCSLFFGAGRKIISDEIKLLYDQGITSAKLQHEGGKISLIIKDNYFSIEAENMNDTFAKSFLPNMKFSGGEFNFKAKGSFDEYSAFITIENILILDFTPLNNTLALLDTIPALLTFSLPEYNRQGFPVTSLTIGLGVKNKVITVESFIVKSPVTALNGVGTIDKNKNNIDMEFNLITQAKTNINKIPLVGYILVGDEERPSITFKISGDLDDPEVKYSTFREIANLPLSILQRTFHLPFKWVDSDN